MVFRNQILRAFMPRMAAPILPVVRGRPLTIRTYPVSTRFFRRFSQNSPSPLHNPGPDPHAALPSNASLSQRLKHLIKAYGWYALGVYIVLSALDFSVAFAGVNVLGAEYVSQMAGSVKQTLTGILHPHPPEPGLDQMEMTDRLSGHGGQEGLYAMLVLAYTIHKTIFLPIRVGLTAALTPRLVNWLSQRGWAGSAGTRRAAAEMRERLRERRHRSN